MRTRSGLIPAPMISIRSWTIARNPFDHAIALVGYDREEP